MDQNVQSWKRVDDRWAEAEIIWWIFLHPEKVSDVLTRCPAINFNTHLRVFAEVVPGCVLRGQLVSRRNLLNAALAAGYAESGFDVAWRVLLQHASNLVTPESAERAIMSVNEAARERNRGAEISELEKLQDDPEAYRAKLQVMLRAEEVSATELGKADLPEVESIYEVEQRASDTKAESLIGDGLLNSTGLMWIHAEDGKGKTALAMQLAGTLAADGRNWLAYQANGNKKVLYLQGEVDRDWWKRRCKAFVGHMAGANLSKLTFCQELFYLTEWNARYKTIDFRGLNKLARIMEEHKANIVVIDPLVSYYALEENSTDQNRCFVNTLLDFRKKLNVAVIGVHHDRKSTKDDRLIMRGSSVLRGASDTSVTLEVNKGGDTWLVWDKLRHARNPGRLPIKMRDDGFWVPNFKREEEDERQENLLPR